MNKEEQRAVSDTGRINSMVNAFYSTRIIINDF